MGANRLGVLLAKRPPTQAPAATRRSFFLLLSEPLEFSLLPFPPPRLVPQAGTFGVVYGVLQSAKESTSAQARDAQAHCRRHPSFYRP